jgi:hypothetical protein
MISTRRTYSEPALGPWALTISLFALFLCLIVVERSRAAEPSQTAHQLLPGEYRNQGRGVFRRIVVSTGRVVVYEIWRATTGATLQHLRFDLVSPTQRPIESDNYRARANGENCGSVSLYFYRDNNDEVDPEILMLSYDNVPEPLNWSGHTFTKLDYEVDKPEIERLAASAREPSFYYSIDKIDRALLSSDVPRCR